MLTSANGVASPEMEPSPDSPNIWGVIPDIEHQRALQPNHTIVKARYQNQ